MRHFWPQQISHSIMANDLQNAKVLEIKWKQSVSAEMKHYFFFRKLDKEEKLLKSINEASILVRKFDMYSHWQWLIAINIYFAELCWHIHMSRRTPEIFCLKSNIFVYSSNTFGQRNYNFGQKMIKTFMETCIHTGKKFWYDYKIPYIYVFPYFPTRMKFWIQKLIKIPS